MDGLWAPKSDVVWLSVRATSFQDFQFMWMWCTNITDRRTDRPTDGRHAIAIPRHYSASRGKNSNSKVSATQHKNRNSLVNSNNSHCADVSRTLMAAETMYSPRRSVQLLQTISVLTSLERWRQHNLCTRRSVQLRHTISALTPEEQRQTMVRWTGTPIITYKTEKS